MANKFQLESVNTSPSSRQHLPPPAAPAMTSFPAICWSGEPGRVRAILAGEADINESISGHTGLMVAALENLEPVVEVLVQQPGLEVNLVDVYDKTALHWASSRGHLGVVRRLLDHPGMACLNYKNKDGETPIMTVLRLGEMDVAKELLLKLELDTQARNGEGDDLSTIARLGGNLEAWVKVKEEVKEVFKEQIKEFKEIVHTAKKKTVNKNGILCDAEIDRILQTIEVIPNQTETNRNNKKKSRIRETKNLSTDAESSTNTKKIPHTGDKASLDQCG